VASVCWRWEFLFPFIGYLQESTATKKLETSNPALYQSVTKEGKYLLSKYQAIDPEKAAVVADDVSKEAIRTATTAASLARSANGNVPAFMLACYITLIIYFKSKGGTNQWNSLALQRKLRTDGRAHSMRRPR